MSLDDLLQTFPAKRIKANDGLAVTAEIWEEAHAYHRQAQRFGTLLYQGWGIATGLEVIASDPPDTSVYILPGVAVDPSGQCIVLPQPVAYDVGEEMEGLLYLILSHGESPARAAESGRDDAPLYVNAEFSLVASTILPTTPYVELARVRRLKRTDTFADAHDPAQPGPNEIDVRFRRQMRLPKDVTISVCHLGQAEDKKYGQGAVYLGQATGISDGYRVTVHPDAQLAPGIEASTLVYLVGSGNIELSSGQMNGLTNYVNRGRGTLFIEGTDAAAEASISNMLAAIGMEPQPLKEGHRLLQYPYLFAAPPPGFDATKAPELLVSDGVIVSNAGYGLLWQGKAKKGHPSREQIRSAAEWGTNILSYAIERRRL